MSEFVHPDKDDNPYGLPLHRGNDLVNPVRRVARLWHARHIMRKQLDALPTCKNDAGEPERPDQAAWREQRRSRTPVVRLLLDENATVEDGYGPQDCANTSDHLDYSAADYSDYQDEDDDYFDPGQAETTNRRLSIGAQVGVAVTAVVVAVGGGYLVSHPGAVFGYFDSPSTEQDVDDVLPPAYPNPDSNKIDVQLPGPNEYSWFIQPGH